MARKNEDMAGERQDKKYIKKLEKGAGEKNKTKKTKRTRRNLETAVYVYTLYLATLAPTTTKVDFHGGRPYKKYYKEYKKEGN